MTEYAVKPGHDQALVDLVEFTQQPQSNGLEYTARDLAADGSVSEQGPFVELIFEMLGTVAEYTALLTLFGLNSATTAEVTIYAPNALFAFTRYNGLAVRPEKGRDIRREILLRDIRIVVKDLTAAA